MNRETITERAYIIASEFNDDDLEIFIKELQWWIRERKRQNDEVKILKKRFEIVKKIEEEQKFIDKQYEIMKQYIFNKASAEELEEHYNWYKVKKGDKEDLLNIMFESYCNTYTDEELEKRIKELLEV